ncbi:hypothetical protein EDD18DRAFT_1099800 [Armillaria luteobubalina]|uniref:Uncharacterized protein n=1 Tax=Armillaria luteobubalina TaxID=153913 RepID=A0AA39UTM0_9AGAR|nr:hypothetical protein EDD18DRAFT_1099800 [Armillaria luteobubalina]
MSVPVVRVASVGPSMRPSIFACTSMLTLSQNICVHCGHGIHAHADYISMVVHHYLPTQCVTYVQKAPLTQRCTCEIWLCDHIPITNLYHSVEPSTVLDQYPPDDSSASYSPAAISISNNTINGPYMPGFTVPVFYPRHQQAFSPSSDMESVPFALASISSPSSSMSSATYSSHEYFVRHPDQFMNNSAHQPHRDVVHEGIEYQGYSNASYGVTPESGADTWSGPSA